MSNFHIGQEVVCVRAKGAVSSHGRPSGLVKDRHYEIVGLSRRPCVCGGVLVDVGFCDDEQLPMRCDICGCINQASTTWWFCGTRFAPLQTKSEEEDMNEAIEEALSQPAFQ